MLSVYAVLKLEGLTPDFQTLVSTKYISSTEGSSVENVLSAIEDSGLHAQAFSNVSLDGLSSTGEPVILYLRADHLSEKPDHYFVFLESVMHNPRYNCG
jgi:hypothetical protein